MLSSFLYTMLTPSKTTSPNKLFDYDCVTLYIGSVGTPGFRYNVHTGIPVFRAVL